jgi:hypothetical protein
MTYLRANLTTPRTFPSPRLPVLSIGLRQTQPPRRGHRQRLTSPTTEAQSPRPTSAPTSPLLGPSRLPAFLSSQSACAKLSPHDVGTTSASPPQRPKRKAHDPPPRQPHYSSDLPVSPSSCPLNRPAPNSAPTTWAPPAPHLPNDRSAKPTTHLRANLTTPRTFPSPRLPVLSIGLRQTHPPRRRHHQRLTSPTTEAPSPRPTSAPTSPLLGPSRLPVLSLTPRQTQPHRTGIADEGKLPVGAG